MAFHAGNFYIADGDVRVGGRVLRVGPDGATHELIKGLPSVGDHHTNGPVISPDGWLYFGQGTATNSGVVGRDNLEFGWLKRHPTFHDRPALPLTLTGENFAGDDLLSPESRRQVSTGAFLPYGTPSQKGQVIPGSPRPTGAVCACGWKAASPRSWLGGCAIRSAWHSHRTAPCTSRRTATMTAGMNRRDR